MGKLTGKEIVRQIELGNIKIDPFDASRVNPNSYNLRLGDTLKVYKENAYNHIGNPCVILDSHRKNETVEIKIPEKGYMLKPGILYLGRTMEKTWTNKYVPVLDGRSSGGRLGIQVHLTAGFGDIGFDGTWTLEILVVHNVIIYPGDEICQISFEDAIGDTSYQYNGRYNHQEDVTASRFYETKKGAFDGTV